MTDWAITAEQERDVLRFDPWGERDSTYVTLRSAFVKAKKAHACDICFGPIVIGERHWAKTETDDGRCKTFRFCAECCWCIAHRYDEIGDDANGGFDRMYERWEIGSAKARQAQATSPDGDSAELQDSGNR